MNIDLIAMNIDVKTLKFDQVDAAQQMPLSTSTITHDLLTYTTQKVYTKPRNYYRDCQMQKVQNYRNVKIQMSRIVKTAVR